jgi:sulfur carrier protein
MIVTVNGEGQELPAGATVATVVERLSAPPRGVAVAIEGEVVPRSEWDSTPVVDGARLEIVVAVQGG